MSMKPIQNPGRKICLNETAESPNAGWNPSPNSPRVPAQPPGVTPELRNSLGNAVKRWAALSNPQALA